LDVVDILDGTRLFSGPNEKEQVEEGLHNITRPILSVDGRTMAQLQNDAYDVWDVDTAKRLRSWSCEVDFEDMRNPPELFGLKAIDPGGRIEYCERIDAHPWIQRWNRLVDSDLPTLKVEGKVHAVYDLRTGAFLYRCVQSSLPPNYGPNTVSSARDLMVEIDGSVYDLPPRVRWWLLLAIQSALALPLVAGWVVRRFLRRTS
jgi:hypothetical protein